MSLSIPTQLSFSKTLSSQNPFFPFKFSHLSLSSSPVQRKTTIIRMGGGPRTYPGGVSKWQWKRMQAKKAKQLLKARLSRERQIYEMRKRAELKAAVSELERPWEVVRRAPTLFSVKADEQVKVLADRFQKPGGFDMWTERDGPQLFETPDGFPSARFFPKGVVHSIKPYGVISGNRDFGDENLDSALDSEIESENELINTLGREMGRDGNRRNGVSVNGKLRGRELHIGRKNNDVDLLGMEDNPDSESEFEKNSSGKWDTEMKSRSRNGGKFRKQGNGNRFRGGLGSLNSGQVGSGRKQRGDGALVRGGDTRTNTRNNDYRTGRRNGNGTDNGNGNSIRNSRYSKAEVFDMDLQHDGSYGFEAKTRQLRSKNAGN
ncbi:probable DEAD-box ATP-dependent RNA helicase 48 [Euphorbia lathyris]|uniref:probable DEAD-box ATP-dependent RNA helicase 48 n=1 Tax=Euphorbia lathyris TaxID=212925 RepID=UPI0033134C9C